MDLEDYSELNEPSVMLAALRCCARRAAGQEDCVARLEALMCRAGRPTPPGVMAILRQRVAAAFRDLCIAGLLDPDEEGRCVLTSRGEKMLKEHPKGVDGSVLMAFAEYRSRVERPFPFAREEGDDVRLVEPKVQYADGYAAFWQGQSFSDNPFDPDTVAHLDWQNGWSQARDMAQDAERPANRRANPEDANRERADTDLPNIELPVGPNVGRRW